MTASLVQVAELLMAEPTARHWGYDLSRRARVRSGVLYPLLHRLLEDGLLEDGWETAPATDRKTPPRRYYTLTDRGAAELGALLARARTDERFRSPSLRPGLA